MKQAKQQVREFHLSDTARYLSDQWCVGKDITILYHNSLSDILDQTYTLPQIAITVVESGEADISIGIRQYHLTAHTLVIIPKNYIRMVQRVSPDFRVWQLFLSESFISSLHINGIYDWTQKLLTHTCVDLDEEGFTAVVNCMKTLHGMVKQHDNPYQMQAIRHLVLAYMHGIGYYIYGALQTHPQERTQEVTDCFWSLINRYFREQRSVAFYAELLHITPKYLSACVKQVTGHTAGESIDMQVISYAQQMLQNTDTGIQQLAYELHFSNVSDFGKYFKRNTGMSPRIWRNNHNPQQKA